MPGTPVGNRAFSAIRDALDLLPDKALRSLESLEVFPTVDLSGSLRVDLGAHRFFEVEASRLNAGTDSQELRPHEAGDWDSITVRGAVTTQAVPADHDAYVVGVGARAASSVGDIASLAIVRRSVVNATDQVVLWGTTNPIAALVNNEIGDANRSMYDVPLPWLVPPPTRATTELVGQFTSTAAEDVIWMMSVLHAPAGVLQPW